MKKINLTIVALALAAFGLDACKKADKPLESVQVNGVSVDMPKFQSTFSTVTNTEIQKLMFEIDQGFRYRDYPRAITALETLSTQPDLTDDQKKVAGDVLDQLKKLPSSAPAQ